jgi:polyisoprenoid-binding protein YceI
MVVKALASGLVIAMAWVAPAAAEPFVLDKGYTALVFSWSHLGLTRQQARFNGIEGMIDIDPQNPDASKVDISIRTASVQSGVDTFDRILRSPDYFDATTYPAITFRSTSIKRTSEVTADVTGELNIRGQSAPVTLAVTLNLFGAHPSGASNPSYAGKKVAAFSAKGRVLRSAWNMARGAPLVSDEIDVAIETELVSKE